MSDYEIRITSKNKPFELNLKETLQYKDLIKLFVKRNFQLVYKQTILGPAWLVLNPLFSSLIYTFIFGHVVGLQTDGIPQFLFYLSGTSLWNMFTNTLSGTSSTFLSNSNIFGKVYFPRLTIPLSQAVGGILKFLIQFAMLICFVIYYAFTGTSLHVSWMILWIPVIVLQTALLAMAVGIIVSSITIKYRDLALATGLIVQMWMYVTPVLYPASYVSGWIRNIIMLNPMTPLIVNFRYCLLGSGTFMVKEWIISAIVTVILAFFGTALFNKTEKNFVDVI